MNMKIKRKSAIASASISTSIEEDPPPSSVYISQKAGSPKRHPAFFFVQNFTLPLGDQLKCKLKLKTETLTARRG